MSSCIEGSSAPRSRSSTSSASTRAARPSTRARLSLRLACQGSGSASESSSLRPATPKRSAIGHGWPNVIRVAEMRLYSGTTVPGPGDLSLNVQINLTGDTTTDGYAFIDAAYCPGVAGVVDVIGQTACGFYWQGATFYPNLAAFVAVY